VVNFIYLPPSRDSTRYTARVQQSGNTKTHEIKSTQRIGLTNKQIHTDNNRQHGAE